MIINNFSTDSQVLVVAEIGNNHEGSYTLAEELIGRASESGAHAVKFQTYKTHLYCDKRDKNRFAMLKRFELQEYEFEQLAHVAHKKDLLFFSTPLDLESAFFLESIVDAFKIASSDNTFYPLLKYVSQTGKPIILSSGLLNLEELIHVRQFIYDSWMAREVDGSLAVLHCVSSYPAPVEQLNLSVIPRLKEILKCTIGYSDHCIDMDACLLAVALGAEIVILEITPYHQRQMNLKSSLTG